MTSRPSPPESPSGSPRGTHVPAVSPSSERKPAGSAVTLHADLVSSQATHQALFRRAATRVSLLGISLSMLALVGGGFAGGGAWVGAAWGGGAAIVLTCVTALALAMPWDRYPLLASSGVLLSFAAKIVVMVLVVILAGPHREEMSPAWFLGSLAIVLLAVTGVEIMTLASGRVSAVSLDGRQ